MRLLPVASVAAGVLLIGFALAKVEPLDQPVLAALDISVGWAFLVAGVAVASVPRAGRITVILSAVGLAWFAGNVLYRGPLVHLLLVGSDGRARGRTAVIVIALAYLDALVETFVLTEPLGIAVGFATVAVALLAIRGTRGAARRTRLTSATAAVAITATLVAAAWAESAGRLDRVTILVIYDLVLVATAVAIAVDRAWRGWSRAAVTGLVVDLGDRSDAGTLRERLARALGDPSLEVAYRLDADDGYVDETGGSIVLPAAAEGRAVTPITSRGEALGALIHDPAVLTDSELAGPVVAAAGLAVANAQLQSDIRRQTADVDASRRRIVRAADRQRRRIERDLRQGVLTRLDAVGARLNELVTSDAAPVPEVTTAMETLDLARDELRRFARGVYPPTLAELGLRGAVADLAARSAVPVTVTLPAERLAGDVEAAGYFVCAEALTNVAKHAGASHADVSGTIEDGWLRLAIVDDGKGGADAQGSGLRGLAGRVEAANGRLSVISPAGGGTRVEAELPLG